MIYNIIAVPSFRKELKKLAKKYRSLKDEMTSLFNSLEKNPTAGTAIGKNCYKFELQLHQKAKENLVGLEL
ncbi:hypothetical protein [Pedobacter sp.]|uniref:hypothetical protein n=1 Tax=Pedobacter sp. TaxID=1411316 RepID=UPI003C76E99E